ncbi:MAG TPA: hypothetical protein PLZ52_11380 [Bacteroidales bacterium]|nr:hypothetical protein [Bacteroidales bacterium]
MKRNNSKFSLSLVLVLTSLLISTFAFAQSPEAISYQAVARNSLGEVLANQSVSFRISLLQGSITGTAVYKERHVVSTNQFGLANLEIGSGTVLSGSFAGIDWGANTYYVKVELDPAGGINYQAMGVSQLLSVPYSLYSKEATRSEAPWITNGNNIYYGTGNVGIGTTSPYQKIQIGDYDGSYGLFTGNCSIDYNGGALFSNALNHAFLWKISTTSCGNQSETRFKISLVSGNNLESDLNTAFVIRGVSGNVGIGTSSPTYKLSVNGTIRSKEVIVNTGWSDFVFFDDYKLMSLPELEKYIRENKHLPDIPTTSEVESNGVLLGDISSKLLQKVEEQTLYTIDLNKRIEAQSKQIDKQNEQIEELIRQNQDLYLKINDLQQNQ